jgi:hypothetical protein
MAPHFADAHTNVIHRYGWLKTHDFVGLGGAFPLFPRLTTRHIAVNPWDSESVGSQIAVLASPCGPLQGIFLIESSASDP